MALRGKVIRRIGLAESDSAAVNLDGKSCADNSPAKSRKVVPDSPIKIGLPDLDNPCNPFPDTSTTPFFLKLIRIPNLLNAETVERQSLLAGKFSMRVLPFAIAARITAR
jgi:hypothetical protein